MKKVLYIENESLLRDVVKEMAQQMGHIAYVYQSNEDLSFYLKDIQPDLVLMDLPSLGEKTKYLVQLVGELVPGAIIWATGWEKSYTKRDGDPISEYFSKPIKVEELLRSFFDEVES